jgi:hypothetical protein
MMALRLPDSFILSARTFHLVTCSPAKAACNDRTFSISPSLRLTFKLLLLLPQVAAVPESQGVTTGPAAPKHTSARLLGAAIVAAGALSLFSAPAALAQTGAAPIAELASAAAAVSAGDTAWVLTSTALVRDGCAALLHCLIRRHT